MQLDNNDLIKAQVEEAQKLVSEVNNLEIDQFFSCPHNYIEFENINERIFDLISKCVSFISIPSANKEILRTIQKLLNVLMGVFNNTVILLNACFESILQFSSWKEFDWNYFKDNEAFTEEMPVDPQLISIPIFPQKDDPKFQPDISIFDSFISSRRAKKTKEAEELYIKALDLWERDKNDTNQKNIMAHESYIIALHEWEERRSAFIKEQERKNQEVDYWKRGYFDKKADSVIKYCGLRLSKCEGAPTFLQNDYEIEYNEETNTLIVEHYFPSPKLVPNLKELRYVKSKNKIEKVYFSESEFSRMYDKLIYSLLLSSINGLFMTDMANALDAIAYNVWIKSIDETTGHEIVTCIISIYVSAEQMKKIDLSCVDPQKCFMALKGISASKLYNLTAIAPILNISKKDKRFVQSHEVASKLDEATNIAAMGWEDFEHLIREIFEKEFSQSGGEVKVTQASRDGGVDAVAFDPDPIRGGKIVIQAKRYTNTVGVSAVRDLYGTLINEGATKGILITTADYGPDAYEFAKGKPLTLLNGNNLLYLLEKHGHKVIIDLKAAKRLLSLEEEED
jgi:restriction system protein